MRQTLLVPRVLLCALTIAGLSGCGMNDRFSSDAVEYNRQAEQVQDQVLLLNILRASKRRPFEFSGVQTISGAASTGEQLSFALPLRGKTPGTLTPTITNSAGPTVTVGVVDTQDFYEGLLKPLDIKLIDLYVQRGLPKVMLFDLFFQKISVAQKGSKAAPLVFPNSVAHKETFDKFQALVLGLANAGLSTDQPDKPKAFGPVLTGEEMIDQENYAAKAATASLDVKEIGWCDLPASQAQGEAKHLHRRLSATALKTDCDKVQDATSSDAQDAAQKEVDALATAAGLPAALYRTQKSNTDYRLCFDLPEATGGLSVCHADKKGKPPSSGDKGAADVTLSCLGVNKDKLCDVLYDANPAFACTAACSLEFSFSVRSTFQIIYYLGEVVRQQLQPDSYNSPAYVPMTVVGHENVSVPLFELDEISDRDTSSHFLSVAYDNQTYAVPDNAEGQTSEVMDLVTELIALNKSAKDLPTSSVITAVGLP